MNTPTFWEQYDKLTRAYIENKVEPHRSCACFVGNLLNRDHSWCAGRQLNTNKNIPGRVDPQLTLDVMGTMLSCLRKQSQSFYKPVDIIELEKVFLNTYYENGGTPWDIGEHIDEDALFIAFEKTLDLLKNIHEAKGEIIDQPVNFTKRILQAN